MSDLKLKSQGRVDILQLSPQLRIGWSISISWMLKLEFSLRVHQVLELL